MECSKRSHTAPLSAAGSAMPHPCKQGYSPYKKNTNKPIKTIRQPEEVGIHTFPAMVGDHTRSPAAATPQPHPPAACRSHRRWRLTGIDRRYCCCSAAAPRPASACGCMAWGQGPAHENAASQTQSSPNNALVNLRISWSKPPKLLPGRHQTKQSVHSPPTHF